MIRQRLHRTSCSWCGNNNNNNNNNRSGGRKIQYVTISPVRLKKQQQQLQRLVLQRQRPSFVPVPPQSRWLLWSQERSLSSKSTTTNATTMTTTTTTTTTTIPSSSSSLSLTPAEAGRRAHQMVQQEKQNRNVQKSATTTPTAPLISSSSSVFASTSAATKSMDTVLSHSGFVPNHENDTNSTISSTTVPSLSSASSSFVSSSSSYPHNAPMVAPIHLSTTYIRPVDGIYHPIHDATYSRVNHPTRRLLEQQMSQLELLLPSLSSVPLFNDDQYTNNREPISFAIDNDTKNKTTTNTASSSTTGSNHSFAMASGMMAISTLIMAHSVPLHVVLHTDVYHGVPTLINNVLIPFVSGGGGGGTGSIDSIDSSSGTETASTSNTLLSYEHVDMRDPTILTDALVRIGTDEEHRHQHLLVWIETPSNPLCHVIDLVETCRIIRDVRNRNYDHHLNTTIVVDSTMAPPNITQPLLVSVHQQQQQRRRRGGGQSSTDNNSDNEGVDAVIHSGTKSIGGHSDAMGGIITVSPYTYQGQLLRPKLEQVQICQGGILSSMDSYLMLRGLRTLHVRIERQCQTAFTLANTINDTIEYASCIKRVYYPGICRAKAGLSSVSEMLDQQQENEHQFAIAQKQMKDGLYGSIFSIELYTEQQAMALIGGLQIIQRATSFGGTETVIEHRASIEPPPPTIKKNNKSNIGSPRGLVRISVGLEHVNDLLQDIHNAICIMKRVCGCPAGGDDDDDDDNESLRNQTR